MRHLVLALCACLAAVALQAPAADSPRQGVAACASCHERQAERFVNGRHGRAMADRAPEMVERACATCHGPVDAHLTDPRRGNLSRKPSEASCAACHKLSREPAGNGTHRMKGRVRCLECHLPGHDEILLSL